MKVVIFISFILCFLACTKMDSDTEIVGSFANALCGYEGTITYADGRPAKNYPVLFFVGHSGATIDSTTGEIRSESGVMSKRTDENGRYKMLIANKNINTTVSSGYALLGDLKFSNFEYFHPEFTVNGRLEEYIVVPPAYGAIQKIDVKLYDVNKLHFESKNIKVDYDNIHIQGKSRSPISGKEIDINFYTGERTWKYVQASKPGAAIDLTVRFFKKFQVVDTRTIRVAMDKKDNYLEIQ